MLGCKYLPVEKCFDCAMYLLYRVSSTVARSANSLLEVRPLPICLCDVMKKN